MNRIWVSCLPCSNNFMRMKVQTWSLEVKNGLWNRLLVLNKTIFTKQNSNINNNPFFFLVEVHITLGFCPQDNHDSENEIRKISKGFMLTPVYVTLWYNMPVMHELGFGLFIKYREKGGSYLRCHNFFS